MAGEKLIQRHLDYILDSLLVLNHGPPPATLYAATSLAPSAISDVRYCGRVSIRGQESLAESHGPTSVSFDVGSLRLHWLLEEDMVGDTDDYGLR